jgi:RHH-type proline utilization regulon transcriptional repressor/proline dehydrogenase/delta 1-pyrroline-5-carboxylate dehydrogenase
MTTLAKTRLQELEPRIARCAEELLDEVDGREARLGIGSGAEDRMLDWCFSSSERRTALLRFVELYPSLRSSDDVARHLLVSLRGIEPAAIKPLLALGRFPPADSALGWFTARAVNRMSRRFIGGGSIREAAEAARRLRRDGLTAAFDLLGEATFSERDADRRLEELCELVRHLTGEREEVHVSFKASALTSFLDPLDAAEIESRLLPRLERIVSLMEIRGGHLHLDAEHYETCDCALEIFLKIVANAFPDSCVTKGVVIQAYLRDAAWRADRLMKWCDEHDRTLSVRLVKGAYWDSETVRARQRGWAPPVYPRKEQTDAAFERIFLDLASCGRIRLVVGTHNLRSLAAAMVIAEDAGIPKERLEAQFLYGMARATREVVRERGYPVRIYTPLGEWAPGMAYMVRRLLENTSNTSFLRNRRLGLLPRESLLASPHAPKTPLRNEHARPEPVEGRARTEKPLMVRQAHHERSLTRPDTAPAARPRGAPSNFPAPEFHRRAVRVSLGDAVARRLNARPLLIAPLVDGKIPATADQIVSANPSHPSRTVAEVRLTGHDAADRAARSARRAWESWRRTTAAERASLLRNVARLLVRERWDLAALEVCEAGKPWGDAMADVAEAIDFLRYYATEMERLDAGVTLQPEVPGEINRYVYRSRGLTAVISPWNFPLAIPAGQVGAALAAGNTVLFKPAEQASALGARLYQAFRRAGVPADVLQFLPGRGEEIGARLVAHPLVDVVAFTGSRAVGEEILRRATNAPGPAGPKRVVAELGGKNAAIVDADADLDLAVGECLTSAFQYAGQKCSAMSRVILMRPIADEFLERFADAARSFPLGFAERPGVRLTPLIDEEARARVRRYIAIGLEEGSAVLGPDEARLPLEGFFAPPVIVEVRSGNERIAQEEIFGPVVAAMRVHDFDEALARANGTEYALTGGVFSRHPDRIALAVREFDVGNLYINRAITGAIVGRQPFGGHRASGVGSKAGGPDYLLQFLIPRSVSENVSRHGFSPDISG